MFGCSEVKINGVQYSRQEGAKLERLQPDPWFPRYVWAIDLIKADNPYSMEANFVDLSTLIDFTADTTLVSADDDTITIDQIQI
jgi:hypothetical protein